MIPHFTVTRIGDEIIATYCDGNKRTVVKQMPTDDFAFDCACAIDTIAMRLGEKGKEENNNGN